MNSPFKAFLIDQDDNRKVSGRITMLDQGRLDDGEVLIRIRYSSINYKDALAATGAGKIIRRFPCVGGIDLSGEVVDSSDSRFRPGDKVIATSFDIGVAHHGGYAEYARVPAGWVVPLPAGLDLFEAMALGTAGFTAALALYRMQDNRQSPALGPLCVTGATGGVGSLAVDIFSRAGYEVHAISGKADQHDYLRALGAGAVHGRDALATTRPMESARFGGGLDNVGGPMLASLLAQTAPYGNVASAGLAASPDLHATVMPGIIRGVSLLGVASAGTARDIRDAIWTRLGADWKPAHLDRICTRESTLADLPGVFDAMLAGGSLGRTVVRL